MLKESDILFEIGDYWICKSETWKGYEVMKNGVTHSVRVASIGYEGEIGFEKAKTEAIKRAKSDER